MIKSKFNSLPLGVILGIVFPVVTFFITYFIRFSDFTVSEYFDRLFKFRIMSAMTSLSVIPNLLLFFVFIWRDLLLSARGVLLSTIIYGLVVVVFKFVV